MGVSLRGIRNEVKFIPELGGDRAGSGEAVMVQ